MLAKTASRFALTGASVALLCAATAAPAWAKPASTATTTSTAGIDVSYPQCSAANAGQLPAGEAFAIVGVNDGLANNYSPCLSAEFTYAQRSTGTTAQPKAQTYLNTGDPGNTVDDWPSPGQPGAYGNASTPSYGTCDYATTGATTGPGANTPACAYVYGYDMVAGITYSRGAGGTIDGDVKAFSDASGGQALDAQPVWLDVETGNSWQTDQAMNVADLQGMVDALKNAAATGVTASVGIYSTSSQWSQIIGAPADAGNLTSLPVWIPGARSEKAAAANCSPSSFTGGPVSITQWFGHPYDGDHSCIG